MNRHQLILFFIGFVLGTLFSVVISPRGLVTIPFNTRNELKTVKEELEMEKRNAQSLHRRIESLRDIIKAEIADEDNLHINAENELSLGWKTVKVLAFKDHCLAKIMYKINSFDPKEKRYDFLLRDADMAKRPDTYIRAFGCWQPGSVIYSEVLIEGKIANFPTFREVSSGDILRLLENPHVNVYMNPVAIALTDILQAIVTKETK